MTASKIIGTGHYLPPKIVTNFDLMKVMDTTDEFIVQRTGVHQRRHAEAEVSASDLAVEACREAVADAGLEMGDIDLLVMNTITPDHHDPGCGFFLQAKLGLGDTPVLDIKAQCMGLVYGLSLADHYVKAGTYENVLVVCSEVLSKRIDPSYDGRNIGILLGDGAGAKALYTAAPGSALGKMDFVDKDDVEAGRVHFRMDGKAVYESGVAGMSGAALESLERNGVSFEDVDLLIPHQANLRMLEVVIERLGVPMEKVFVNVVEYGNMASACLPVALDQARKQGRIKEGQLLLLIAFGSGFVWGSALIRM